MAAPGDAPPFWWERPDWRAWALWPVSSLYGFVAGAHMANARREKVPAAVLCVGNLTVGGEGKTPVAIALAKEAKGQGLKAGFLSRGHGGSLSQPHFVDADMDTARLVGDEPLLLARHAPTVVTPDRAAGARCLVEAGCDFVVMDDGFQSARIHMDYALIVVDAGRGIGNGHVIPAGPLRAPLIEQLRHADSVLVMGKGDAAEVVLRRTSRAGKPVFAASVKPRRGHELKGTRVLAFAGIGNPEKFYHTLRGTGAEVEATRSFPDHYPFGEEDVAELAAQAGAANLQLVTTEKDLVRLNHGSKPVQDFAASVRPLPIEVAFETADMPARIIRNTVTAWRERMLKG